MIDAPRPAFTYPRFDDSLLDFRQSHSRYDNRLLRLSLQKAILELPGGPVSWSLSLTAARGNGRLMQSDNVSLASTRSKDAPSTTQISVSLPVSSQGSAFTALRDLAVDLSLGRQSMSGGRTETSYGGGMTWAPLAQIQLRGSIDLAQNAPSFDQLNGPIVTAVDRFFDYAKQAFVESIRTTGGNPLLRSGNRAAVSASMTVKPLRRKELALNLAYRQFVATDSPVPFPELTPAIEEAFPERVTRSSTGQLLAVDARPINVERQKDASLSSS
jgi:hypothetical protein